MDLENYILSKISEVRKKYKKYTEYKGEPLRKRNIFSRFKSELDKFLRGQTKRKFIVMPGLRGVGKTTILMQIYEYLVKKTSIDPKNILYITVDDLISTLSNKKLLEAIRTYYRVVHENTVAGTEEKTFLLIDEAHYDENWDRALKVVWDNKPNAFIIATGSSALSLTVSTDVVRRAEISSIFPLSYQEYLVMKYNICPPRSTAETVRKSIFEGPKVIEDLRKKYNKIKLKLTELDKPRDIEFKNFLKYGGLPYTFLYDKEKILEKTERILERIIYHDLATVGSFKQKNIPKIKSLMTFLALKKPGRLSYGSLSNNIDKSKNFVERALRSLEKTGLLLSTMAYGGAGKTTRKSPRYFFATPTIKYSLMEKIGRWENSKAQIGMLLEHLVASRLFRMKKAKKIEGPSGIFYDSRKGGADFLVSFKDYKIPIEVGIGEKSVRQVETTMDRFNSPYGVLICDTEVEKENKIIKIPHELFSFA